MPPMNIFVVFVVYSSLDLYKIVTFFFAGPVTNLHKISVTKNSVILAWGAPQDSSETRLPVLVVILCQIIVCLFFCSMIHTLSPASVLVVFYKNHIILTQMKANHYYFCLTPMCVPEEEH